MVFRSAIYEWRAHLRYDERPFLCNTGGRLYYHVFKFAAHVAFAVIVCNSAKRRICNREVKLAQEVRQKGIKNIRAYPCGLWHNFFTNLNIVRIQFYTGNIGIAAAAVTAFQLCRIAQYADSSTQVDNSDRLSV